MNEFRPQGYRNPHIPSGFDFSSGVPVTPQGYLDFEAGASEILKSLRETGVHQADKDNDWFNNKLFIDGKWVTGNWVFIPDDPL